MAALLQLRPTLLRYGTAGLMFLLLSPLEIAVASPAIFLDAIVAAVDSVTITASDIALARALNLFGFQPSDESIMLTDIERTVDARLVEEEAARMGIGATVKEAEEAWQAAVARTGGTSVLSDWAARHGIPESRVREIVQADFRWRRFIELRFRAFVFVSEADLVEALGPGPQSAEVRERTRETLTTKATDQELARWLADARTRARIQYVELRPQGFPTPFPMPSGAARQSTEK